jgi:hypothetical protein
MKILSILFITVILVSSFVGCQPATVEITTQITTNPVSTAATPLALRFQTQYIRTDSMSVEDNIYRIESGKELRAYYDENKDKYYDKLGRMTQEYADTIGFLDAIDNYDDDFFAENLLVFILRIEPSGSYRHKVINVLQSENATEITVNKIMPNPSTCDIAFWHIMVELKKSEYNGSGITVIMN